LVEGCHLDQFPHIARSPAEESIHPPHKPESLCSLTSNEGEWLIVTCLSRLFFFV